MTGFGHLAIIIAALAITGLSLTNGHSWRRILVAPLEQRIPPATLGAESSIEGIIALGGDFDRFKVAVEIAKSFPQAKLGSELINYFALTIRS